MGRRLPRIQPLARRLLQRGAGPARRCRPRDGRRRRRVGARGGGPARARRSSGACCCRAAPAPTSSTTTPGTNRCGPRARRTGSRSTRTPVGRRTTETSPGRSASSSPRSRGSRDRTFRLLAWSGAFERHPGLQLVMTEQGATWLRETLAQMDHAYDMPMFVHLRRQLPLAPSEYFARQCAVSTFVGREEADARYDIGVDALMWGSDYPHIEGTWPHTAAKLEEGLAGVARDEVTRHRGRERDSCVRLRPRPLGRARGARRAACRRRHVCVSRSGTWSSL